MATPAFSEWVVFIFLFSAGWMHWVVVLDSNLFCVVSFIYRHQKQNRQDVTKNSSYFQGMRLPSGQVRGVVPTRQKPPPPKKFQILVHRVYCFHIVLQVRCNGNPDWIQESF